MILPRDAYVPALRWRQGEYQALLRLSDEAKARVVPLITIPDLEFDFEDGRPKKSVQDHVKPFPRRFFAKWGQRPAWIGVHRNIVGKPMADGRDIFTYVFQELRGHEANAIPEITLDADVGLIGAVATIVKSEGRGVAISVRLEDLMRANPGAQVQALVSALGADLSDTDLIIDLGAPNFEPYEAFAGALAVTLAKLGDLNRFRNFVLIGTAIPQTFKDIAKGADEIPRHDWLFYRKLITKLPKNMRRPNFGDYTIVHPAFAPVDMRKIKSAGKVIYTTSDTWLVHKGGAFRDNREQMHDHCAALMRASVFRGSGYSSGDDFIAKCAVRTEGPSTQTRWKEVGINHHITHVLDDLATLGAAP